MHTIVTVLGMTNQQKVKMLIRIELRGQLLILGLLNKKRSSGRLLMNLIIRNLVQRNQDVILLETFSVNFGKSPCTRKMDQCILRKLQTNGERMVPLAKLRNVRTSGAASTQTHPMRLDMMRMSGMKEFGSKSITLAAMMWCSRNHQRIYTKVVVFLSVEVLSILCRKRSSDSYEDEFQAMYRSWCEQIEIQSINSITLNQGKICGGGFFFGYPFRWSKFLPFLFALFKVWPV
ncbi:uncharacterized protein LOC108196620 isoform X1 [Daucus carota subsp. sativus]|uniref:uncharacterized protein LOC108196620 isoform X1 n=2 Tax=Daucus carota subsp. sativus TaxID=79200 RepID=UPI0007EFBB50|nr:PREDICTED: uncharacterized protein LOC108196620 isoform X3 [Daucus carota subsp. sativus]